MGLIYPTRSLVEYHPYRISTDTGEKTKNPKFDEVSRQLLDLKDATANKHRQAVAQMTRLVSAAVNSLPYTLIPTQVHIAVVPSSTRGKWSEGLCAITKAICDESPKRFVAIPQSLQRIRTIDKLARGGNRSVDIHLASIAPAPGYERYFARKAVILLDDVTTTGNSLRACCMLLQQHGIDSVYPFALGRTV